MLFWIAFFLLVSCSEPKIYTPVGQRKSSQKKNDPSVDRARSLNRSERERIQNWIKERPESFYDTSLNYWTTLAPNARGLIKEDGERVSYCYDLFDLEMAKIYDTPFTREDQALGKFEEIMAIEDAVRLMNPGDSALLVLPSTLAYGIFGDGKKIRGDTPLVVKLRVFRSEGN